MSSLRPSHAAARWGMRILNNSCPELIASGHDQLPVLVTLKPSQQDCLWQHILNASKRVSKRVRIIAKTHVSHQINTRIMTRVLS